MMVDHRYILEPYGGPKTRYHCPLCEKSGSFSRYLDTQTREHLHEDVGRCNHVDNCGYHLTPSKFFEKFGRPESDFTNANFKPIKTMETTGTAKRSFIPESILKQSLNNYNENNFVQFLLKLFGDDITKDLMNKFSIGTAKAFSGGTIFWYINIKREIAYGRVMKYNIIPSQESIIGIDCKRDKEKNDHCASLIKKKLKKEGGAFPDWLQTYPVSGMIDCFFGENQLRGVSRPVGIVESEKTAIIASGYFPDITWLATGSKGYLKPERCGILKGRNVTLFPDVKAFNEWKQKSESMGFRISELLERKATPPERELGADLADYLIRDDYRGYRQALVDMKTDEKEVIIPPIPQDNTKEPKQTELLARTAQVAQMKKRERREIIAENVPPDPDTLELIRFFETVEIPQRDIILNDHTTITQPEKFIRSHIAYVEANHHCPHFSPYKDRLKQIRAIIISIQIRAA